ncbi:hypothetical protein EVG20_g7250 [Dentipellis fragilis]|uniref:Uncharacterized protein n=1 Tax=Dentipellis fragilis TaxID=205917 RepID=A0A4Y9YGC0_9AGAM|nr:hypothetical protein EVG20_g7250 [Dentipellis fragilis]
MLYSRLFVLLVASITAAPVLSSPMVDAENEAAVREENGKPSGLLPPELFGVSSHSEVARQATCDPCDDSCDIGATTSALERRSEPEPEPEIRVIYGNDTEPFLPGEGVRWRIVKRQLPILEFDCSATSPLPEVCQNMCYGVNCRGHPTTLTRNTVGTVCAAARRRNTCGSSSPNRCSARHTPPYPAGNNCDEYPFASTVEGQQAGTGNRITAVTRCVIVRQNSIQGGRISAIYRTVPQGGQYTVSFNLGGGAGTVRPKDSLEAEAGARRRSKVEPSQANECCYRKPTAIGHPSQPRQRRRSIKICGRQCGLCDSKAAMANIPYLTFNNGTKVPSIGMGCWMGQAGGGELVKEMCTKALAAGYRHFDTAAGYENEAQVGAALRESGIPREELYVTTKLSFEHNRVRELFDESLQKLGLEYIDLYLMHWPNAIVDGKILTPEEHPTIVDTWKEMEKLLDTGKVKSIGVSNFSLKTLNQLLPHCKVVPATNQVELHPYLPQHELKAFCEERGILLTAYSPLGQRPSPSEDQSVPALFADPTITALAEKYKTTIGQILISWSVQRGTISIPKSSNTERMKANITLVKLDEADTKAINGIHEQPGKHRSLLVYQGSKPGGGVWVEVSNSKMPLGLTITARRPALLLFVTLESLLVAGVLSQYRRPSALMTAKPRSHIPPAKVFW